MLLFLLAKGQVIPCDLFNTSHCFACILFALYLHYICRIKLATNITSGLKQCKQTMLMLGITIILKKHVLNVSQFICWSLLFTLKIFENWSQTLTMQILCLLFSIHIWRALLCSRGPGCDINDAFSSQTNVCVRWKDAEALIPKRQLYIVS
jgi:chromate transport protein ChrA